jgi:acetyl esterase/lipase
MPEHHEVPNPIHPSVLPSLDPAFVKLYNEHIANIPNKPIDLNSLRSNYSVQYSYATAAAPEASKTWDAKIPGYQGAEISVRVYEPASPGPWPVHIDFHGGGEFPASQYFEILANSSQDGDLEILIPNPTSANIS